MNVRKENVAWVSTEILGNLLLKLQVSSWGLQVGNDLRMGRTSRGRGLEIVEGGSEMDGSSGRSMTSGRLVAKAPDRTLGVVNFLGEALGNLNMCQHPDEGQILTTTIRNWKFPIPRWIGIYGFSLKRCWLWILSQNEWPPNYNIEWCL